MQEIQALKMPNGLVKERRTQEDNAVCGMLGFEASALWDSLSYLKSLSLGLDGALKWALYEKPWVLDTEANIWEANDPKGHASHVAGGRWGMRWYDGTNQGQPKPIVHVTSFLARYLTTSSVWTDASSFNLSIVPASTPNPNQGLQIPAEFRFSGSDILIMGGLGSNQSSALRFETLTQGPALVMAYWSREDQKLYFQANTDATVEIQPDATPFCMDFKASQASVVGLTGGVKVVQDCVTFRALAGELVEMSKASVANTREEPVSVKIGPKVVATRPEGFVSFNLDALR